MTREQITARRAEIATTYTDTPGDSPSMAGCRKALRSLHEAVSLFVSYGQPPEELLSTAIAGYMAETQLQAAEKALDEQQTKQN